MISKEKIVDFKKKELEKYRDTLKAYKFITTDSATLMEYNFSSSSLQMRKYNDSILHFENDINYNSEELIEKLERIKNGDYIRYSTVILPYDENEQEIRLSKILESYTKDESGIYVPTKWVTVSINKYLTLSYEEQLKNINYLLSSPNDIEEFPCGHGLSIKHNIFRVPYSLYLLTKYQRKTLNIEETEDFSRILK